MSRPSTALIVDDEPAVRTYVRLLMKELGLTTFWEAGDGGQALALFAQHKPELVLLDVNLRMTTGLQVLQRIKQLQPGVPVIMLSSEDAAAYLLKQIPKDQALAKLRETLDSLGKAEPAGEG